MSIAFGVTCLDCKRHAPPVGSFGFLGAPVLAALAQCPDPHDSMPSFGYFYEALCGVGLRPYQLERFSEFLAAHEGHRLVLSSDHDEPDTLPSELVAINEDDSLDLDLAALESDARRRKLSGEFAFALYEIRCHRCGVGHASEKGALLRADSTLTIDPAVAQMFVERWDRDPGDGWNHHPPLIVDPYEPFMEQLVAFLKVHGEHRVRARLVETQSS